MEPRGPLSAYLCTQRAAPQESPSGDGIDAELRSLTARAIADASDVAGDDDLQLSLFLMYGLHTGALPWLHESWEWDPETLRARATIERAFETELRSAITVDRPPAPNADAVAEWLFAATAPTAGPSLARFVAKTATIEQLHEFLMQRSIYTLREADPHSWAIPRLTGRPKAALVEIQADEYGGGNPERMHAAIFGRTLRGAGLDDTYGAYLDRVPAVTLASQNMMSMFGLNRRLRGAIVGHLAAFEMTSSIPNRQYGDGFRRHGFDDDVTRYFDEHVEADAVHEQIAGRDLAGALAEEHPELLHDILFGALACLEVDGRVGDHILGSWERGESSLRAAR